MTRGSTWNIWDFHLHTPHSILNNEFGPPDDETTWEDYVSAIETTSDANGIAAIGITDYFVIEGYKRIRQYQEVGRLQNLFIFPNIEFRLDKFVEDRRLNAHVLFSPEVAPNLIEEHFLHDLDFVHQNQPFQPSYTRKLKLQNLREFGEELQKQHEPFQDRSPLEIGCTNATVNFGKIKERLESDGRFAGKYLLVLAEENLSNIEWNGQDHATRKELLQMSHALFSSNAETRKFCLGKFHPSTEDFISEFKSLKPCIWGSDSHGFEQRFLKPDQDRFCWIKGEVSWEGLKQILYEPESRIRIQSDNPEPQKSIFTLDVVHVDRTQVNDNLCIDEINFNLNHNLVTIIGGRGSGKTALLDLIAACFPEGEKLKKLKTSFYHRVYASNGSRSSHPVPISLNFRSGERFMKQVGSENENNTFERTDILYLTQNHMEDYTANPFKLYSHIIELIFDQSPDQRQQYDELANQAQSLQMQIQSINLEIEQLQQQVSGQLEEFQSERSQKQGELADYQSRLNEYEEQQEDSGTATAELTNRLQSIKAYRNKLIALLDRLKSLLHGIQEFQDRYKHDADAINSQITALSELDRLNPLPTELDQLNFIVQRSEANVSLLNIALPTTEAEISNTETQLNDLEGIDRVIAQTRRTIDNITNDIDLINQQTKKIEEKMKRIDSLGAERIQIYAETMHKMIEQRRYLQQIIDRFETGQDDLLTGLSFTAVVDSTSRSQDYIDRVADKMDGRVHSLETVSQDLSDLIENMGQHLNNPDLPEDLTDTSTTLPLVQRLSEYASDIRLKKSATMSEFFNALFSTFFQIGLYIEFNDRSLESLSMGERAVVLLKILLGLDDKPLLIDQPEEHLDNRYIYDVLTPAFRKAKDKRQIMIATHNANLVVNTDAEQIIVADHTDGVLSYEVGTLEDLEMRETVKTILEGGDQAFKKREAKYGYRF